MNYYYLIKKSEVTQRQVNLSKSFNLDSMRTVLRNSDQVEFCVVEIDESFMLRDEFIDLQPLTADGIITEIQANYTDQNGV